MSGCRISAARDHGAHLLKLEGDVRLIMCTALDEYFDRIFADPEFVSVWVDVTGASGLDSTTLGMLAKLAIRTRDKFGFKPALFSCDPGINRLLNSMGFSQLFELHSEVCGGLEETVDIPVVPASEDEVKRQVIEAHRTLMGMSDSNRDAFEDLVRTLESD